MSIIFGVLSSILSAISGSYRKKAIDNSTLPNSLQVLISPIIGAIIIYFLIFIFGINTNIFKDNLIIILLFLGGILDGFGALLESYAIKNTKISKIMPYASFDKLFIIILGFIIFYGNPGYTSYYTLLISIFTVIIIMLFSINLKNLYIEKEVKLYILAKFLYACTTLIIGKILFEYSTLDIFAIIVFFYIGFHLISNIILKNNFLLIIRQSRKFYKYRLITAILGRIAFIISIFLIENSGVLVASLLSFITIVFSIISMKVILGDSPTPKQIFLSILVIIMIGIGYYFK